MSHGTAVRLVRTLTAFFGSVTLAGCSGNVAESRLRANFSAHFSCSPESVKVERWMGGYEVTGCEHLAHYDCISGTCDPTKEAETEPAVVELRLTVVLDEGAVLRMTAVPSAGDKAELWIDGYPRGACPIELFIDGKRRTLQASNSAEKELLSRAIVEELGSAEQVGVRACRRRWLLARKDLGQLRQFVDRYLREVGEDNSEDEATVDQPPPPLDGWQAWQPLHGFPDAVPADHTLTAQQLFDKLAPAIARVECKVEDGFVQGSAVAIAPTLLATNCHVIRGALQVTVKQGTHEWSAKLRSSDTAKDRCVLEVPGARFTPVGGVRAYADLMTGERLYALGAPSGLDLTLTDGILSARREDSGVRYIQTTAPISPGSSGGGLFDVRGNLVGITTLSFVGKERLNQSLNFAVAAEMFWTP